MTTAQAMLRGLGALLATATVAYGEVTTSPADTADGSVDVPRGMPVALMLSEFCGAASRR